MTPQRWPHSNPRICGYVLSHGKRHFADVHKLKILEQSFLDYLDGPNLTTVLLLRGRQEGQRQRRKCEDGSTSDMGP